ncbi:MAG: hypothetical protein ABJJ53_13035 [Sulfitobacter sp.]
MARFVPECDENSPWLLGNGRDGDKPRKAVVGLALVGMWVLFDC